MIHYIITFKVVKKQENRKTEKTGSKTCAKYAVNCVNKEMGVGELPCVYVRSTQEGHTHTRTHTAHTYCVHTLCTRAHTEHTHTSDRAPPREQRTPVGSLTAGWCVWFLLEAFAFYLTGLIGRAAPSPPPAFSHTLKGHFCLASR